MFYFRIWYQFGFRPLHSTAEALLIHITNEWHSNMDSDMLNIAALLIGMQ
jgi:hypothetical protein